MIKDKISNLMKISKVKIDDDVFNYGFNILTTYLKYLVFIVPLSIILGEVIEVLLFLVLFIPIRRFIGGFHFKNLNYCFIGSVITAIILPFLAMRIYFPFISMVIISSLTLILTICIGVVDHPNKILTAKEKINHTRKTLLIESVYVVILIIVNNLCLTYIYNIIILIFIFCTGGLLVSKYYK